MKAGYRAVPLVPNVTTAAYLAGSVPERNPGSLDGSCGYTENKHRINALPLLLTGSEDFADPGAMEGRGCMAVGSHKKGFAGMRAYGHTNLVTGARVRAKACPAVEASVGGTAPKHTASRLSRTRPSPRRSKEDSRLAGGRSAGACQDRDRGEGGEGTRIGDSGILPARRRVSRRPNPR